jgi:hypothetical protein
MEITSHLQITDIRNSEEKRIEIGNQVYLVSKHGISIRKEIIFEKFFDRVPMDKGVAQHFKYKGSFNIHGKLLEIDAENKTTFGPLGDRLILNAYYDSLRIGNYSALISYMGGGSSGIWPSLKTKEWSIVFTLNSTRFYNKENLLRLEYFQTIIYDPSFINEKEKRKCVAGKTLTEVFLNDTYKIEDLEKYKIIEWLIPIRDDSSDVLIGKISCCSYPGFEKYHKSYFGNVLKILEIKGEKSFIGKSLDNSSLFTIQIDIDNGSKIYYPWNSCKINYNI